MDHQELIKKIVLKNAPKDEFDVYLFGSRAKGTAKKFSDFDVGFLGKDHKRLNGVTVNNIEQEFEDQLVPYFVDLVDLWTVPEDFRQNVLKEGVKWA